MLKQQKRSLVRAIWIVLALFVLTGCPPETSLEERELFSPWDMSRYEFDGVPEIEGPARLLFLNMEVGDRESRQGEIKNVGRTGLVLKDFAVEGPFDLDFPEYLDSPPSELSPGQSLLIEVSYRALDEDPVEGLLTVFSNDPETPGHEIALLANVELSCVEVQPSTRLRFGSVQVQSSVERMLTVTNCSETVAAEVYLEEFENDGGFRLSDADDRAGRPRVIAPGRSVLIPVEFRPQEVREYRGAITVVSDDEFNPRQEVELDGQGAPADCPLAVLRGVSSQEQVRAAPQGILKGKPLETISLSGAESRAFGGESIVAYEWALILRPQDTVVELNHHDISRADNGLYLELAGSYEVELHVVDSAGTRSCEPARLSVESVSGDGLHVQLVWDTPSDNNRHDNLGADVDLHLLRQGGRWNHAPWDCYWMNMNPIWEDPFDPDTNPSLDIDRIPGWGPENINLRKPQSGINYSVGVYYFDDHGFGSSYATVRIFIDGELRLELKRRHIRNWQFWHVADVSWPGEEITIFDTVIGGFPN